MLHDATEATCADRVRRSRNLSSLWWLSRARTSDGAERKAQAPVPVLTANVERRDVPVRLSANGSVVALQSVDLRAQITGTVREVHIREGQFVRAGELLVSLDSRSQDANVQKAAAQVEKDRGDLATAARNLDRQRELFDQQFISRATLDVAQSKAKGRLCQVQKLNGHSGCRQPCFRQGE